jgi:hypothetical protein
MIALPELHNLIRSLSKPEKRFFKLLSATENYPVDRAIALFDHIEKIGDHDDVYIKTDGVERVDVTIENLDLLYKLILKSQRNFYSETITGFTLNDELCNLKILFEKAQHKQCRKMIKSVKEKAFANEKFSYLLEILELEKKLLHTEVLGSDYDQHYSVLKAEKERIVECEKNVGIYYQLYSRLKFHIKSKTPGVKQPHDFYKNFLEETYIKNTALALSRRAQFLLMKCRALCYNAMKQFNLRLDQLSQLKRFMQEDDLIFDEMPRQYIDVLYSLTNAYIEKGDYLPARNVLSEIQSLINSKKFMGSDLKIKAMSYAYNCELQLLLFTGRNKEASDLAQTIYEFIKDNQKIFNKEDKSVLLYNLVNYHICSSNYATAAKILDITKTDNDRNSRWDTKAYSRIQEMVVYYELEELPKFNLAANATRLLLKDKIFQNESENQFIEFFTKNSADKFLDQKDFQLLYDNLKSCLQDENELWVNYFYFNFCAYAGYKAGAGEMKDLLIRSLTSKEESLV